MELSASFLQPTSNIPHPTSKGENGLHLHLQRLSSYHTIPASHIQKSIEHKQSCSSSIVYSKWTHRLFQNRTRRSAVLSIASRERQPCDQCLSLKLFPALTVLFIGYGNLQLPTFLSLLSRTFFPGALLTALWSLVEPHDQLRFVILITAHITKERATTNAVGFRMGLLLKLNYSICHEVMDDPELLQSELFRGSSLPISHTHHVVCLYILTHCKSVCSPAFENLLISYTYFKQSILVTLSAKFHSGGLHGGRSPRQGYG